MFNIVLKTYFCCLLSLNFSLCTWIVFAFLKSFKSKYEMKLRWAVTTDELYFIFMKYRCTYSDAGETEFYVNIRNILCWQ